MIAACILSPLPMFPSHHFASVPTGWIWRALMLDGLTHPHASFNTRHIYDSFTVIFSQSFIVILIQSYSFLFILVQSYSLTYSICYPTLSCLFVVSCIRMFILNYYSSSNFVYVQKIFRSKLVSFTQVARSHGAGAAPRAASRGL